jgi:outer membrane immunogenic protein
MLTMRTHNFTIAVAAFCVAGLSQFAFAGSEPVVETKPAPEPYNWTGLYMGKSIGATQNDYEFSEFIEDVNVGGQFRRTQDFAFFGGTPDFIRFREPHKDHHEGSVMGGGQVGYDFQFGHWVVGVEGDYNRTSVNSAIEFRDTGVSTLFSAGVPVTATTTLDVLRTAESTWNASARLRLGWAYNQFLFYATGGGVWSDLRVYSRDTAGTSFVDAALGFVGNVRDTHVSRENDTVGGWTAGAGIEFAASDAVTFALEYRHNGFGSSGRDFHGQNRIFPGSVDVDLDSDQLLVKMNLNVCHLLWHHEMASTTAATDAKDYKASKNVAVMPVETFNWSGLYIGANGGGNWTDWNYRQFDTDVDVGNLFFGTTGIDSFRVPFRTPDFGTNSDDSVTGGGQIGYNFQFGHWVVGVEGDFDGLSSRSQARWVGNNTGLALFGTDATLTNLTTEQTFEQQWNASARGRIGWASGPVLSYITGGAVWADVASRLKINAQTDFFSGGGTFLFPIDTQTNSQNEDVKMGWTIGAGAEWAFNDLFTIGMEYRHNEFDDVSTGIRRQGPFLFSQNSSVGMSSDQVTVKINVLLGRVHPR